MLRLDREFLVHYLSHCLYNDAAAEVIQWNDLTDSSLVYEYFVERYKNSAPKSIRDEFVSLFVKAHEDFPGYDADDTVN